MYAERGGENVMKDGKSSGASSKNNLEYKRELAINVNNLQNNRHRERAPRNDVEWLMEKSIEELEELYELLK